MSRDDAILLDIAQAAERIGLFIRGMTKDDFLRDLKTQSAVLHQMMIIGEAAGRISRDFRDKQTDVPWHAIISIRNILIHEYQHVDLDEVWQAAVRDIPDLSVQIETLLPVSKE
jgi:uncharacterized protein with HEPN domain